MSTPLEKQLGDILREKGVELEKKPSQIKMSVINNFGLDISHIICGLGFKLEGETEGGLKLMTTPDKILGLEWTISPQETIEGEEPDPNLFTIFLDHGERIGYVSFLRQIGKQGHYRIFFP